jgi:hypothetical protein
MFPNASRAGMREPDLPDSALLLRFGAAMSRAIAVALVCVGLGFALGGFLWWLVPFPADHDPHPPLYARARMSLHIQVAGKVWTAGVILLAMGLASLVACHVARLLTSRPRPWKWG